LRQRHPAAAGLAWQNPRITRVNIGGGRCACVAAGIETSRDNATGSLCRMPEILKPDVAGSSRVLRLGGQHFGDCICCAKQGGEITLHDGRGGEVQLRADAQRVAGFALDANGDGNGAVSSFAAGIATKNGQYSGQYGRSGRRASRLTEASARP
jgi:hypothetical protein